MKDKNEIQVSKPSEQYFTIKDFFQQDGRNAKAVIEEYIIREASNLI